MEMDRNAARQEIRKNWRQLMRVMNAGEAKQRVNGEKSYICPLCGHGKGGDGLTYNPQSKDGYGLKCFGCDFSGDIIDLYEQYSGADYNAALQVLAGELGITIEKYTATDTRRNYPTPKQESQKSRALDFDDEIPEPEDWEIPEITFEELGGDDTPAQDAQEAPTSHSSLSAQENPGDDQKTAGKGSEGAQDEAEQRRQTARDFIAKGADQMTGSPAETYIKGRGFIDRIIKEVRLGYDKSRNGVVIPYPGKDYYIVRRMNVEGSGKYYKPPRDELGEEPLFIIGDPADGLLICEGQLDAIALYQAGAAAVAATGGAGRKHLETLEGLKKAIIIPDNDEPGKKNAEAVKKILDARGVNCCIARMLKDCKDVNEVLLKGGAESLTKFIGECKKWFNKAPEPAEKLGYESTLQEIKQLLDEARASDNFSQYRYCESKIIEKVREYFHIGGSRANIIDPADSVQAYIDNFMGDDISRFKNEIKTGFNNLDEQTGGLYPGLYVIAAASSLGKTTFSAQLADQLAKQGHHVLFFSLEMSRLEMVSKSLARKTAQNSFENTVTSLSIRRGYTPPQVKAAVREYTEEIGDRLSIIEGNFGTDISFIGDYVQAYTERTGAHPVVFIDYLQVLQPVEDQGRRKTTKENIDDIIVSLKRLSREMPIFAISSINRGNYLTPIDFESLKESGGIEYGADVIWGLQLQCLNDDLFDSQNKIKEKREKVRVAKMETPRKIELLCLKNRYGISSFSCYFNYYPACDLFTVDAAADFKEEKAADKKKVSRRL